ncbi:hypothetical protein GCM10023081_04130 [Arthrobacter ginkgonis]|uniref:Uncharacterized protein n=1 Tax=Arthrobacter ginkgonis TaxID=1630594 RepID=A0ABP7BVD4_9MICC
MTAAAELDQLYTHRHERARAAAASGTPVIGIVGADVPRELVLAAGALPVRLHAAAPTNFTPTNTAPDADHSSQADPSPETVRSAGYRRAAELLGATEEAAIELLGRILDGELAFLTGLLISHDRDSSLRIFQVLRELAKADPTLPPVHLIDLLHLPRAATETYNLAQIRRAAVVLGEWTGAPIEAAALAAAIEEATAVHGALLGAHSARIDGLLAGSTVLRLFAAAEALAPTDALDLIDRTLAEAPAPLPGSPLPGPAGGDAGRAPAVFLSGSAQETDALYRGIEAAGWQVVGEDHHRGLLATTIRVETPATEAGDAGTLDGLLAALARAYGLRGPDSATASAADRASWTVAEARRAGADAILSWVHERDDAPRWDFPRLREAAARHSLPAALSSGQAPDPEVLDQFLGQLHPCAEEATR